MIGLLICLLLAIVVAAAVMGVVRAVLALPPMNALAPYGGLFYAVVVLLVVLLVIEYCFSGGLARHF
jgi:hypothetical protein